MKFEDYRKAELELIKSLGAGNLLAEYKRSGVPEGSNADTWAHKAKVVERLSTGATATAVRLSTAHIAPPPAKTPAQWALEISKGGSFPADFTGWDRPRQISMIESLIPMVGSKEQSDLRWLLTGLKGVSDAELSCLATQVGLGVTGRETRAELEKAFYQAHLTFPGMSAQTCFRGPDPVGFGRTVKAGRQDSINKYFRNKK